jgi:Fe-S-cluster containining protein
MKWEIEPADITSEVCTKCIKRGPPHCCEITLTMTRNIPPLAVELIKRAIEGIDDLRIHNGELMLICQHLDKERGSCNIYEDRPQICENFNCVSWAKVDHSGGIPLEKLTYYNKIKRMFREEKKSS